MQRRELIEMMNRRSVESFGHAEEVITLANKYPYCATFQVLKAIGLKENDSLDFSTQLNRAAIAIQDRSKLYNYIVKDQLLKRIEDSERESSPVGVDILTKDRGEEKEEEANALPIESKVEPSPNVSEAGVLSAEPMEAEILREAIAHLGEMEASQSFQEFSAGNLEVDQVTSGEGQRDEDENSEPMSFGKWLLQKDKKSNEKKDSQKALINKFIQESPQISPVQAQFFSPSQMGKLSLVEDETFVTETLAGIYLRQGDYKKAARAYQNLGLKYPEKRTYFAALQKKAEDHLNN